MITARKPARINVQLNGNIGILLNDISRTAADSAESSQRNCALIYLFFRFDFFAIRC